jgi:metallo-beta-lactamase class B
MERKRLLDVVIVGSWYVNPGYRLLDRPGQAASYPGIAADYEWTFSVLKKLRCDVFLGAHGVYFDMLEKLSRVRAGSMENVWVDPLGYQAAVAERQAAFEGELMRQQQESTGDEAKQ